MIRRVALVAAMLVLTACGYDSIKTMDEAAATSQALIAMRLEHRADLVPNLVDAVKGFAAPGDSIYAKVADSRAKLTVAVKTGDVEKMVYANSQMTGMLTRLVAIADTLPALKTSETFLKAQSEMAATDVGIARARMDYAQQVHKYNEYIREFPASFTAKVIGASPRKDYMVTSHEMSLAPKPPPKAAPATKTASPGDGKAGTPADGKAATPTDTKAAPGGKGG